MNKLLLITALILIILGTVWSFFTPMGAVAPTSVVTQNNSSTSPATTSKNTPIEKITRQPSAPDRQVYINQDWRFSFEYPVGWKISEPAFGSGSSLFNLAVWPEEENAFYPLILNITKKSWGDRFADRFESTVVIATEDWYVYPSVTMSVIPTTEYFLLRQEEYWINISVQQEFEKELQIVLDSFQFHNPVPALKDIGIAVE